MKRDKIIVYVSSITLFIVLLLTLFFPQIFTKLVISLIFIPLTIAILILIKKRDILSIHKKQLILIMLLISALYLVIYYLLGIYFGFTKSIIAFSIPVLFKFIIPLTIIIFGIEMLRSVFLAQQGIFHKILFFICCIMLDIAIYSNVNLIYTFDGWLDIFGNVMIGSIASNLLFNYLSKRYGYYPNIIFRLFLTLYSYIIPVVPNIPDIISVFIKMCVPFVIYLIINSTYGKKDKVVSRKKNTASSIITVCIIGILLGIAMIISNTFNVGMLVIGSNSMAGEINKGDIIFYTTKDAETDIHIQDIIVFKKNETRIVHRVIDIYIINGEYRYITKGDANDPQDSGYITQDQIVGVVSGFKLRGLGWPTIWLRDIFK